MTLIGTSVNGTNSVVLTATTPPAPRQRLPEPTEFNIVQIDINKTGHDSREDLVEPIKDIIESRIDSQ